MTIAARDTAVAHPATIARSSAPIEVMHVITSLDVGGAETVLARLVTGGQDGCHLPPRGQPEARRRAATLPRGRRDSRP